MSTYTTQLRYVCEEYAGRTSSGSYAETAAIIADARPKIFDFQYPLHDPAYKPALETKIINHFYFREIGAETVGQFKFMLSRTLNEIMPYYNQLYKTADMEFNPFYDVDYYKDHKGQENRSHDTTGSETTESSESRTGTETAAATGGSTSTSTTNTNRERTDAGTETLQHNTTDTTTYNSTDTRTLNTVNETELDTTDTKTLNTTETTTLNNKETVRESDTPQGALTNIENNTYLSNAKITDRTGSDSLAKTGTETLDRGGTETVTATGTDTTAKTGTDTIKKTGTDTTNTNLSVTEEDTEETEGSTTENRQEQKQSESGATISGSVDRSGRENILGTDEYIDHIYGKTGAASYTQLMTEYRESLINIDMMVIHELEICFMQLY